MSRSKALLPQHETEKVAVRGLFAKLHFALIDDSHDWQWHSRERRGDSDYYLLSFDLYLDDRFTRLVCEDMDAADIDDEFLAELLDAPDVRVPANEELIAVIKDICLAGAKRSDLADLGVV